MPVKLSAGNGVANTAAKTIAKRHSGVTPRELTHYVLEAVPALAIGLTALAFRVAGRPRAGSAVGWLAGLSALLGLLVAAEAVLILPAEETALLTRGQAAVIYGHSIPYAALPGYYARWVGGQFESPRGFPGPMGEEMEEARLIESARSLPAGPLLVLGDRAWIYFLSRRQPAVRYLALNSAFRVSP